MPIASDIKKILAREKEALRLSYNVRSIGLFGSFARGEAQPGSDIDILVEFASPIGLLKFIELEDHLSSLLGAKVDLVSKKALKPGIGRKILAEVVAV